MEKQEPLAIPLTPEPKEQLRKVAGRGVTTLNLQALGLLLGVLLTGSSWNLFARFASPGSGVSRRSVVSEPAGLSDALRQCEQAVAQTRARLAAEVGDGSVWLRVASLEMHRADLLALRAYPHAEENPTIGTDAAEGSDLIWRQRFLQDDPEGALSRAAEAARRALRTEMDHRSRCRALLLLANAQSALGDDTGAAGALAHATRQETTDATLWMLLSGAYRRAGRFVQAEAALQRAEALIEKKSTKP